MLLALSINLMMDLALGRPALAVVTGAPTLRTNLLKTAVLVGAQLASTASSEDDSRFQAALHSH